MQFLRKKKRRHYFFSSKQYVVYEEFDTRTLKDCQRADELNLKLYNQRLNKLELAQQSLRENGEILRHTCKVPPTPTNVARFHQWHERRTLLPACDVAEAVLKLHENNLELYKDYEPQHAIVRATKLVLPVALKEKEGPTQETTLESSAAAPQASYLSTLPHSPMATAPLLYPRLTEIAGYPPGYSHVAMDTIL
tara:strand:- start:1494 stop:2075 length:582 start_codon:yes stop_codon:yes gene_type:complete